MWSGFQAKKLNTHEEFELQLAANRAEPENQAWLYLALTLSKKKYKIFFQKIKSATMPIHHVKGQPAASTYVREKGCVKKYSNRDTPCTMQKEFMLGFNHSNARFVDNHVLNKII